MEKGFNLLRRADIFGRPIFLNYKQRNYFQTHVGGITTFLLLAILIIYFNQGIQQVLNKDTIFSEVTTIKSDMPTFQALNPSNFMFGLRIQQTDFVGKPFLNLTIAQVNQTIDNNGVFARNYTILTLERCTEQHWANFIEKSENLTAIFQRYQLGDALCPRLSDVYSIQGLFFNNEFKYLRLGFSNCIDTSKCKTSDEMTAYIAKYGFLRVNFYYPGIVVNPSQKNYMQKFIDDSYYFQFTPGSYENVVNTDDSLFLPWSKSPREERILSLENRQRTEISTQVSVGTYHASFFLRRSQTQMTYNRYFKSILQFLSELGGIAQVILATLGIFFFLMYGLLSKISLINDLYDIDLKNLNYVPPSSLLPLPSSENNDPNNNNNPNNNVNINNNNNNNNTKSAQLGGTPYQQPMQSPTSNNGFSGTDFILTGSPRVDTNRNTGRDFLISNSMIEMQNGRENTIEKQQQQNQTQIPTNYPESPVKLNAIKLFSPGESVRDSIEGTATSARNKSGIQKLWLKFHEMTHSYQKVGMSLKYLVHTLSLGKLFNNPFNKLIDKSLQHISEDLDIYAILFKLQEIEKLKTILLDDQQRCLFSFFPKPLVQLDEQIELEAAAGTAAAGNQFQNQPTLEERDSRVAMEQSLTQSNANQQYSNGAPLGMGLNRANTATKFKGFRKSQIYETAMQESRMLEEYSSPKKKVKVAKKQQRLISGPENFDENKSAFARLYAIYSDLFSNLSQTKTNQEVNRRLISCLGNDLLGIFKFNSTIEDEDMNSSQVVPIKAKFSKRKSSSHAPSVSNSTTTGIVGVNAQIIPGSKSPNPYSRAPLFSVHDVLHESEEIKSEEITFQPAPAGVNQDTFPTEGNRGAGDPFRLDSANTRQNGIEQAGELVTNGVILTNPIDTEGDFPLKQNNMNSLPHNLKLNFYKNDDPEDDFEEETATENEQKRTSKHPYQFSNRQNARNRTFTSQNKSDYS